MPLVPDYVDSLIPYQPGKSATEIRRLYGVERVIKLASNENPLGPSPKALARVAEVARKIHLYPEGGRELREALAERYHLKTDNVVVGSGSEAIMSNILRTFLCDDENVLTAECTFIGFFVLARSRGIEVKTVPMKEHRFDLTAIANAITPKTKIIYLANPNNPSGTSFSRNEFEWFLERVPETTLVILDEAYFEYALEKEDFPDSMQYRHDNVITLRTFSKAYGLAGIRIGYGFAHEDLCNSVRKVKLPFEPSVLAEAAGLGALEDEEFLRETLEINRQGKLRLAELFSECGIEFAQTDANFYMTMFESESAALNFTNALEKQGVIVRPLRAFGFPQGVRITIGTPDQNEILATAVKRICETEEV